MSKLDKLNQNELQTIDLEEVIGVAGRYKLIRGKAATGAIVEETPWCDNLIVGRGLDVQVGGGTHSNSRVRCAVGTSNAAVLMSNTALGAQFAVSVDIQEAFGTVQATTQPYYVKYTMRHRFAAGTFNNTNIAEVGMQEYYGSNYLISRALVVDANGNPTTLTLLSEEFLDVIWEYYYLPPSANGTFNMIIDGVSTAFTYDLRPSDMDNVGIWASGTSNAYQILKLAASFSTSNDNSTVACSGATLAGVTGTAPTRTGVGRASNGTMDTYITGSYERTLTWSWSLNYANFNINGFRFVYGTIGAFQMVISPAVAKLNTKTFAINIKFTMANVAIPTN